MTLDMIEHDGQWRAAHAERGCDGRVLDSLRDHVDEASHGMQVRPDPLPGAPGMRQARDSSQGVAGNPRGDSPDEMFNPLGIGDIAGVALQARSPSRREFAVITLVPMPEVDFQSFEVECTSEYARDNVRAGRWTQSSGLARAQEEFRRLLPAGLRSPNHFVYNVTEQQGQQVVGFLWFAEFDADGVRTGHVYSIHIQPEHRGRGYAKAAIDLIEAQGLARGLRAVSLHVFSHNAAAQALYRSLGYGITGFNMLKLLQRDDA